MIKVLPISFRSSNEIKNDTKTNTVEKEKFPITYEKHVATQTISLGFGSVIMGGLAALILRKGLDLSKKTATTGAVITSSCIALAGLFKGLNGYYKVSYLKEKRKFEKEQ